MTATYSFADVQASITGPNGSFMIGSGSGAAEEGITFEPDERNTMTKGADDIMHNLHVVKSGKVTVRLLKTSPVNAQLALMGSAQLTSSALHGKNIILVTDPVRGDVATARKVAFNKLPTLNYAVEGGTNEWIFDVGQMDMILGAGVPDVNI